MSDQKLRDLERRWKETGSTEDEAAYLLERVRAGELRQEEVEVLACLGRRAAEAAAGTWRTNLREIVPGERIGPFRLGMARSEFERLAPGHRTERRGGSDMLSIAGLRLWFSTTTHRLFQVLTTEEFGGTIDGVGPGCAYADVEAALGPVVEDDEDALVIPARPGLGIEAEATSLSDRVWAFYVFSPGGRQEPLSPP